MTFLESAFRGTIPVPPAARVSAAIAWLDRAMPKGATVQSLSSDKGLSEMSLDDLRAMVASLKAEQEAGMVDVTPLSLDDMLS